MDPYHQFNFEIKSLNGNIVQLDENKESINENQSIFTSETNFEIKFEARVFNLDFYFQGRYAALPILVRV